MMYFSLPIGLYHCTESSILRVMNDILIGIDNKNVCLLTLLDLSAAFDTIDHTILLNRLECTFGLKGTALKWFFSYLTDRTQCIKVDNEYSNETKLSFGVPQGSVLGPVLFSIYTQPIAEIITAHRTNYHKYADDTQLYNFSKIDKIPALVSAKEECISDVKEWMITNKMQLNDSKTEIIFCSNPRSAGPNTQYNMNVNNNIIKPSNEVKNLGVMFDCHLSMTAQVNSLCKNLIFQLHKISSVRSLITEGVATTLMTSLVLSRLDYCNSVLFGISQEYLDKLQLIQNHASKIVKKKKKHDHVTPLLKELHWLPIKHRINYKIALLCFKCLNGMAPVYLTNLLKIYQPTRALRSSNDRFILVKPEMNLKSYGERTFIYAGPHIWNSLPYTIRSLSNINTFKSQLKSHFFRLAFES